MFPSQSSHTVFFFHIHIFSQHMKNQDYLYKNANEIFLCLLLGFSQICWYVTAIHVRMVPRAGPLTQDMCVSAHQTSQEISATLVKLLFTIHLLDILARFSQLSL